MQGGYFPVHWACQYFPVASVLYCLYVYKWLFPFLSLKKSIAVPLFSQAEQYKLQFNGLGCHYIKKETALATPNYTWSSSRS